MKHWDWKESWGEVVVVVVVVVVVFVAVVVAVFVAVVVIVIVTAQVVHLCWPSVPPGMFDCQELWAGLEMALAGLSKRQLSGAKILAIINYHAELRWPRSRFCQLTILNSQLSRSAVLRQRSQEHSIESTSRISTESSCAIFKHLVVPHHFPFSFIYCENVVYSFHIFRRPETHEWHPWRDWDSIASGI